MAAPTTDRFIERPHAKAWLTLALFIAGFLFAALINRVTSFTADPKAIIGCIAAALSIAGLGYCMIDALWGTSRPHLYSWLIWVIVDAVAWYNQWTHQAGPGAWSTLVMTILSAMVFLIALYQYVRKISDQPLTHIDQWCLGGALVSIALLIVFDNGPISIMAATITDACAFVPTLKKVWHKPHSETPVNYMLNTFRHVIVLFATQSYNFVTLVFPVSLVLLNGLTAAEIVIRRRVMSKYN